MEKYVYLHGVPPTPTMSDNDVIVIGKSKIIDEQERFIAHKVKASQLKKELVDLAVEAAELDKYVEQAKQHAASAQASSTQANNSAKQAQNAANDSSKKLSYISDIEDNILQTQKDINNTEGAVNELAKQSQQHANSAKESSTQAANSAEQAQSAANDSSKSLSDISDMKNNIIQTQEEINKTAGDVGTLAKQSQQHANSAKESSTQAANSAEQAHKEVENAKNLVDELIALKQIIEAVDLSENSNDLLDTNNIFYATLPRTAFALIPVGKLKNILSLSNSILTPLLTPRTDCEYVLHINTIYNKIGFYQTLTVIEKADIKRDVNLTFVRSGVNFNDAMLNYWSPMIGLVPGADIYASEIYASNFNLIN